MISAEKILARVEYDTNGGCWLWRGHVRGRRYALRPQIYADRDKNVSAYRASYETFNGPIPDGLWVLHRCDVPLCVNPAHLFLGNRKDNVADMCSKARQALGARNGQSKLTAEDVLYIRSSDERPAVLAERFGVHMMHIHRLRRGERWAHIGGDIRRGVAS